MAITLLILITSSMLTVQGYEPSLDYEAAYEERVTNSAGINPSLIRDIFNVSVLTIFVCAFLVATFAFFVKIH
ncbi:hypothetical protein ABMA27_011912 [Loxostege sticticalis]|uniref:Uncharacterized protein n=1 Tax=Loxostege sticticalis TaxID=481309 RepID=A0ABR3IHZ2_LOXSC